MLRSREAISLRRYFKRQLERIARALEGPIEHAVMPAAPPKDTGEKIDFHGLQLVPFAVANPYHMAAEPMDLHPKSKWHNPKFIEKYGGFFLANDTAIREISLYDEGDLVRRDMLVLLMRTVIQRQIEGDFAEVGVFRGLTARLIHYYAPDRHLHLFDTFSGFDERDLQAEPPGTATADARAWFKDTNMAEAVRFIEPRNSNVHFHQGFFPDCIPLELRDQRFAFVHLDLDLYAPITAALAFFYDRAPAGAIIVVHDYNSWFGARKAVDDFFSDKPEVPIPMPDRSGSVVIVRQ